MEFKIINKKPIINKNGENVVDLATKSIEYKSFDYYIVDAFYVSEDIEMRPDLLSYAIYGNTDDWDKILKFNGISNPFSLGKNDFILVPELSWMGDQMYDPLENPISEDIRSQYLDNSKVTNVDPKKLEYDKLVKDLQSINKKAQFNKIALPPNLAQFGETEVTKENGKIILG